MVSEEAAMVAFSQIFELPPGSSSSGSTSTAGSSSSSDSVSPEAPFGLFFGHPLVAPWPPAWKRNGGSFDPDRQGCDDTLRSAKDRAMPKRHFAKPKHAPPTEVQLRRRNKWRQWFYSQEGQAECGQASAAEPSSSAAEPSSWFVDASLSDVEKEEQVRLAVRRRLFPERSSPSYRNAAKCSLYDLAMATDRMIDDALESSSSPRSSGSP